MRHHEYDDDSIKCFFFLIILKMLNFNRFSQRNNNNLVLVYITEFRLTLLKEINIYYLDQMFFVYDEQHQYANSTILIACKLEIKYMIFQLQKKLTKSLLKYLNIIFFIVVELAWSESKFFSSPYYDWYFKLVANKQTTPTL